MPNPCFDFQVKEKDYGLTPEEIRPIWEFAKANYLDKGVPFEDTIVALSKETGAPPRFFAEAFAGPKSQRIKTKEIYSAEGYRKRAVEEAKNYVRQGDTPPVIQALKAATDLPRASLTALHGGVFPVTHGGGLLLRPSKWGVFAKGFATSWKSISRSAYNQARVDLLADPFYEYGRQSNLKINPDEGPQGVLSGWLSSKEGWSRRAWLGLQRMRLEYFKQLVKGYPERVRSKEFGQEMAEIANHATGVTSLNIGPIGKPMFAPQLTASKIMRALFDPAKTLTTFARLSSGLGRTVTAGERAAAYARLRGASEFLGTVYAGLLLNDALLKHQNSKTKINFDDPKKADWMRFKTADGHVFSTRGPEEILRLVGHLVAIGAASKQELHGKSPQDAAWDTVSRFAQYKVNPDIQVPAEILYGTDTFGRPLPPTIQKMRGAVGLTPREGTPSKPQYSGLEYGLEKSPIFIGGAAREIYENMKENGMSEPDAITLLKGAAVMAGEFAGVGTYKEQPPKTTTASSSRPRSPFSTPKPSKLSSFK